MTPVTVLIKAAKFRMLASALTHHQRLSLLVPVSFLLLSMAGIASSSNLSMQPSALTRAATSTGLTSATERSESLSYGYEVLAKVESIEDYVNDAVTKRIRVFRHHSEVIKRSPYKTVFMDMPTPLYAALKEYAPIVMKGDLTVKRYGMLTVRLHSWSVLVTA